MTLISLAQESVADPAESSGIVLVVGFFIVCIAASIGARSYRKRRG